MDSREEPATLVWPAVAPTAGTVRLRAFRDADVDTVLDMATDRYIPTIGTLPHHADRNEALAYVEHQRSRFTEGAGFSFCIADTGTDEALGGIGLWTRKLRHGLASAGYAVAPRARGRHVAAQALAALTRFGWTIQELYRIELYIEPWNVASKRTAAATGFHHEGLLRSHQWIAGRLVDMELFALLRP